MSDLTKDIKTTDEITVVPGPLVPEILQPQGMTVPGLIWNAVSAAAVGLCVYHGYKRNNSIGWGVAWGLLGSILPVFVVPVALVQGIGVKAKP